MKDAHIETESRHERGTCCKVTFAWCYGIRDMFDWFKALWHITDD